MAVPAVAPTFPIELLYRRHEFNRLDGAMFDA
jgi:hypothetical protein